MSDHLNNLQFAVNCVDEGLFKFRPYESKKDITRAKDLLSGRLFFPMPPQLNDPFEMRNRLVLDDNRKRMRKGIKKAALRVLKEMGGLSAAQRIQRASQLSNKLERNTEVLGRAERQHHDRLNTDCTIFSLAGTRLHPLLWSHYASKHKGICVQFDHTRDPFKFANKVSYTTDFPAVTYPFDDSLINELIVKSILTKAKYWDYEKEFRLWSIRMGNESWHMGWNWLDKQTVKIDTNLIKSVTLGARMGAEERDDVINHCQTVCPHVEIEEAITSKDRYELEFKPIGE